MKFGKSVNSIGGLGWNREQWNIVKVGERITSFASVKYVIVAKKQTKKTD